MIWNIMVCITVKTHKVCIEDVKEMQLEFYCIFNCQKTSYQRNILQVLLKGQGHQNAFFVLYFIFVNLWKLYPPHNPFYSMHEFTNYIALLHSHIPMFVLFESVNKPIPMPY